MVILKRLAETGRAPVSFQIDGKRATGLVGDTLLTAILTQRERLRVSEFEQRPRAGFCLIGACQDCWVRTVEGVPLRACTTALEPGMQIVTGDLSTAVQGSTEAGSTKASSLTHAPHEKDQAV